MRILRVNTVGRNRLSSINIVFDPQGNGYPLLGYHFDMKIFTFSLIGGYS